ncbi:MAG: hypothetical protein EA405_13960 [Rhodospirillales bacterium]|nr:MAG: hypothetical protein EA405_13960 [Rhodospirillales bacterium]
MLHRRFGLRWCPGLLAALTLAVTVPITGCSRMENWSNVHEPPTPKAELVTLHHIVAFPGAEDRLSAAERRRLEAFVTRVQAAGAESVHVHPGVPLPGDSWRRQQRRADAVATILRRAGAAAVSVDPLPDGAAGAPAGAVGVAVRRHVVTLPPCPDWTRTPHATYNNQPSSNWGCATAINFGVMLHDPRDLVRGRDLGPADGEHQARAIKRYREDEVRPLMGESASDLHGLPTAR